MRLLVVAGHGAGDPGAVGHGFTEAERVRALANRMKALGGNSVILGDTSQDWYRSGLFNNVNTSTFDAVVELHMDSGVSSACGGHVIIQSGFSADAYDNNLANFLKSYFPGRAEIIKRRNDLANPDICARRGINYRMVEVCFITNHTDMTKFNNNLDVIAKGILASFGIGTSSNLTPTSTVKQTAGNPVNDFGLWYRAHVEDLGWLAPVHDGQVAGTTGYGLRLEALMIDTRKCPELKIKASAHIQDVGTVDYGYITHDTVIGTTGQRKRLEAIMLEAEGLPEGKKLYVQMHFHKDGWGNAVSGGDGGSFGISKETQAIKMWIA